MFPNPYHAQNNQVQQQMTFSSANALRLKPLINWIWKEIPLLKHSVGRQMSHPKRVWVVYGDPVSKIEKKGKGGKKGNKMWGRR